MRTFIVRFVLPATLLAALRERRHAQRRASEERALRAMPPPATDIERLARGFVDGMDALQREVEETHDAFLLDPGMGPMLYVTANGRVLVDERTWEGDAVREATADEAVGAIVVGAKKTGIAALLDLLPARPSGAATCATCDGARWITLPAADDRQNKIICLTCHGRGWRA